MQLPFRLDCDTRQRKSLGLIVLSVDETIEAEFRPLFCRDDAALHHSRIESAPEATSATLARMKDRIADAARLLPAARPLDVVGFACTSGATVIGSDRVDAAVRSVQPGTVVTDPARAVVAALGHLNVSRIGIVSPYVAEVSDAICALLAQNGLSPVSVGSFGQAEEAVVARIALPCVEDAICAVGSTPDVEAVFASCTNLRSLEVIEACERRLGKPVISSNLALAWHMMTLAGLSVKGAGPGRLFNR
ncbi:aspartate/glutamate racemase family protein [Labrenzia sp. 011]|uniref:maleate cis-trans isomerase family protein n=1 Tax=Labrenzia sp. 011 TaxID=2171494 RepID=UPI000D5162FB|nr:aspartate/glutamate racemase family protein [Labrenzia sp. 011]PVB61483.1 Asp/Glu racemase [Labrenzia sp. 011]